MTEGDEFLLASDKMKYLLFGIRNNDDTMKIDQAIKKARAILTSYSPTDPRKAGLFNVFGDILKEAFRRTHKMEYLNESISLRRKVTEDLLLPDTRSMLFPRLSNSLLRRFVYSPDHRKEDLKEAVELLVSVKSMETRGHVKSLSG